MWVMARQWHGDLGGDEAFTAPETVGEDRSEVWIHGKK
jgi:hypothetical protein